jgi:hypothetical protein
MVSKRHQAVKDSFVKNGYEKIKHVFRIGNGDPGDEKGGNGGLALLYPVMHPDLRHPELPI